MMWKGFVEDPEQADNGRVLDIGDSEFPREESLFYLREGL